MASNNDPLMPIQIHAIHPDSEAIFKAQATSPKDLRTTRSAMHAACTKCFKNDGNEPGLQLRRCGKCKSVWYCSKECQTAHWPLHKKSCSNVDGSGIRKLVEYFYSNMLLNKHLQACFILHFGLLHRPQLDKPFMARLDIAIEPADMPDFFKIFIGQPVDEKVKGMLESANKNGFGGDSVGLIEIGSGDSDHTITLPVHIQRAGMELAREASPWVMKSAITGQVTEKPFNIENCMEFMNTHIRADKKNQLLLRTEMRPSDIQIIRDAAGDSPGLAAQLLKAKMSREHIFKPLMVGDGFAGRMPLV
ncbi:hypothetical protein FB451DRAFT_1372424 [Mycena latifolia]|nr:hypothetical protein FB451DRAFT_1372424 [Mycena latifolia]